MGEAGTNVYSSVWFDTFLRTVDPANTEHEVAFLIGQLPFPAFRRVLDICCGYGRHARLMAEQGYEVTGIDREPAVLAEARQQAAGRSITFIQRDMRALDELGSAADESVPLPADAAIVMWASWGYFEEETNLAVLRRIRYLLRPGGRLVLDIYHREFFEQHQGERIYETVEGPILERKRMLPRHRLEVILEYGQGRGTDHLTWQIYTPEEIQEVAAREGWTCLLLCSDFDAARPPSRDVARMQVVLEIPSLGQ